MRAAFVVVVAVGLVASSSWADDKKKKDDKGNTNFDDLFGAPQKPSNLDAMKKASDGVGAKTSSGTGLAAKAGTVDDNAQVVITQAFAAERIVHDDKKGCQIVGKDKIKIVEWDFDDVPARGKPFEVCLTMSSPAGREVKVDTAIVDSRNGRVATGNDMFNFSGHNKIDSVLEFPAPLFKMAGQYFYVVDVDGKEAARVPLFVVKVGADSGVKTSGDPGHAAPDAKDQPLTAKEPDAK